jgi:hypothetical protein
MSRNRICYKTKNLKSARRYVWTDEVEGRYRHIYIRCVGCRAIFELSDTRLDPELTFAIDSSCRVWPCVVCPECRAHVYTTLKGYEASPVPDVFRKRTPRRVKGSR